MKLPIKKEYFEELKKGDKTFELRDAHITFVCEETGETIRKEIQSVEIDTKEGWIIPGEYPGCFDEGDNKIIIFKLKNIPTCEGCEFEECCPYEILRSENLGCSDFVPISRNKDNGGCE